MDSKRKRSTARPVRPDPRSIAGPVHPDDIAPEVLKKYTSNKPLRWVRQFPIDPPPEQGPVDPNDAK